jgi:hypothetical protein
MQDLGLILFGHRHRCMRRVRRTKPRGPARLVLRGGGRDVYLAYRPRLGWECVAIRPDTDHGWWKLPQSV